MAGALVVPKRQQVNKAHSSGWHLTTGPLVVSILLLFLAFRSFFLPGFFFFPFLLSNFFFFFFLLRSSVIHPPLPAPLPPLAASTDIDLIILPAMNKQPSGAVSVTTTTATGKTILTTGPISSLILPSSLVPYIWPNSPASFCTGVVVGLALAFLRPMIEFYVDIGASYISFIMRYILIWGSVAFIAWAILRTLQQTSAATLVINPEKERQEFEQQQQQQQNQNFTPNLNQSPSIQQQAQQQLISIQSQAGMVQRPMIQYQQHAEYDELINDQPPILYLHGEESEIDYGYDRSRPPSSFSNASGSRIMGGHVISSSASIYSDLSSGSSNISSNGNYYSPPMPQYNPYRKSPSPTRRSVDETATTTSAAYHSGQQARIPPSQNSGRTSPARKIVQSTVGPQHATATVVSDTAYSNGRPRESRANPASTSPTRRPLRSASPNRERPEKIQRDMEPKIVSLDDEENIGNAYRPYPPRIPQNYGGGAAGQPEGLSILEKPIGQSAFRMKRKA